MEFMLLKRMVETAIRERQVDPCAYPSERPGFSALRTRLSGESPNSAGRVRWGIDDVPALNQHMSLLDVLRFYDDVPRSPDRPQSLCPPLGPVVATGPSTQLPSGSGPSVVFPEASRSSTTQPRTKDARGHTSSDKEWLRRCGLPCPTRAAEEPNASAPPVYSSLTFQSETMSDRYRMYASTEGDGEEMRFPRQQSAGEGSRAGRMTEQARVHYHEEVPSFGGAGLRVTYAWEDGLRTTFTPPDRNANGVFTSSFDPSGLHSGPSSSAVRNESWARVSAAPPGHQLDHRPAPFPRTDPHKSRSAQLPHSTAIDPTSGAGRPPSEADFHLHREVSVARAIPGHADIVCRDEEGELAGAIQPFLPGCAPGHGKCRAARGCPEPLRSRSTPLLPLADEGVGHPAGNARQTFVPPSDRAARRHAGIGERAGTGYSRLWPAPGAPRPEPEPASPAIHKGNGGAWDRWFERAKGMIQDMRLKRKGAGSTRFRNLHDRF